MKQNYFIGIVILFLIISANSFAQISRYRGLWKNDTTGVIYFVSNDPSTSKITLIKSVPDLEYNSPTIRAFDVDSNRYFFVGGNYNSGTFKYFYYVLNAQTGDVISVSHFTGVYNIQYNPFSKKFIGLWKNEVTSEIFLVSINPANSIATIINSIPGLISFSRDQSTFDIDSNRYFFVGANGSSGMFKYYYYILDGQTGAIISTSPEDTIQYIAYSPFFKKNVGLLLPQIADLYFVSFNPSTSAITLINTIPGIDFITEIGFFNSDSNKFIIVAGNSDRAGLRHTFYFVIDGQTGNIISKSPYNDVTSIFYVNNSTVGIDQQNCIPYSVNVYPNPALATVNIELPEVTSSYQIQFFNTLGQIVIDKENNLERITEVDVENLPSGMYSILIKMNEKVVSRKFMKQ